LQNVVVFEVVIKWSIWHTPFPSHFDGTGPYPMSLKLSCSGQTPISARKHSWVICRYIYIFAQTYKKSQLLNWTDNNKIVMDSSRIESNRFNLDNEMSIIIWFFWLVWFILAVWFDFYLNSLLHYLSFSITFLYFKIIFICLAF
jgi:hypothetical protein